LQWLSQRGVTTAMLYVEHDNAAARRTYERMGFEVHHADHAFRANIATGGGA
jgi:mycothiol synthase